MNSAVKTLFEATDGCIERLNIDTCILKSTMMELVSVYIAEGNFKLAFKAAKHTEKPENIRKVFEAIKDQSASTERPGVQGIMKVVGKEMLFFDIFMAAGTDEELREVATSYKVAEYSSVNSVVRICEKLKDVSILMNLSETFISDYIETCEREKKEGRYSSGTSSIPGYILTMFEAAKKQNACGVDDALERFGDRLVCQHGFKKLEYNSKAAEAIRAYELVGTPSSLRKAAEGYLETDKFKAARLFHKIGDHDRVKSIIFQIVQSGKFAEAMSLRAELFDSTLSKEDLDSFMKAAESNARDNVLQKIEQYLSSHDNDAPFPTRYTFWHFSDGNDEWGHYLNTVHGLAARTDAYCYRSYPSIAKELYATDKIGAIKEIHFLLQGHLLVGYLLSALALEVNGACPSQNRKYEHAFDAVFRTFLYGMEGDGYNPFSEKLDFSKDADIMGLYKELTMFDNDLNSLKEKEQGWMCHTYRSRSFLKSNCGEVQEKVRVVYKKFAEKIHLLLTHL